MTFRAGWYEVSSDARTHKKRCRYFKTPSVYVAECLLEPNGAQLLIWSDPPGAPWRGAIRDMAERLQTPAGSCSWRLVGQPTRWSLPTRCCSALHPIDAAALRERAIPACDLSE